MVEAPTIQLLGAGGFGAVIGWYVYYINRYRKAEVQLGDLVTLIGAIGGSAILALFPNESDLFGAYGIGLFAGFFSYFISLVVFVAISPGWTFAWFLDGRRPALSGTDVAPDPNAGRAMGRRGPDVPEIT